MSPDQRELQSTTGLRLARGQSAHRHFVRHSTLQDWALALTLSVLWTLVAVALVGVAWWIAVK